MPLSPHPPRQEIDPQLEIFIENKPGASLRSGSDFQKKSKMNRGRLTRALNPLHSKAGLEFVKFLPVEIANLKETNIYKKMRRAIAPNLATYFDGIRSNERDVIVQDTDPRIAALRNIRNSERWVLQFDDIVHNLAIDGAGEVCIRRVVCKRVFALAPGKNELLCRDLSGFAVRAIGKPAVFGLMPVSVSVESVRVAPFEVWTKRYSRPLLF